jgi:hypothetical protein
MQLNGASYQPAYLDQYQHMESNIQRCHPMQLQTHKNPMESITKTSLFYYVFVFNKPLCTMFTIQQHQKPSTSTNTNPKNKTKQQKIKIKPNFINSPITIRANKKNQIYRIWGL